MFFFASLGAIPRIPPKLGAAGPRHPWSARFRPSPPLSSPRPDPASPQVASGDAAERLSAGEGRAGGAGLGTAPPPGSPRAPAAPLSGLPPPPSGLRALRFPATQTRGAPRGDSRLGGGPRGAPAHCSAAPARVRSARRAPRQPSGAPAAAPHGLQLLAPRECAGPAPRPAPAPRPLIFHEVAALAG